MKMPDSATAALRIRESEQERRESFLPSFEEARDDLLDRLMNGETYPPKSRPCVSLSTVLQDYLDASDLEDMIRCAYFTRNDTAWCYLDECLTGHVRAYLDGPGAGWVERRRQDMADEAEEDANV